MNKTMTKVFPPSEKPDNYGNLYVNVIFDDDTAGYIGAKGGRAQEHYDRLSALVLKPAEFTLEDKGKITQSGLRKLNIKEYPGFQRDPGPAEDGYKPASTSSPEREDSIARAVALKAAVRYVSHQGSQHVDVLTLAEQYLEWLQGKAPSAGADGIADAGHTATKAASRSLSQAAPADGSSDADSGLGNRGAQASDEEGAEGPGVPSISTGVATSGPDALTPTLKNELLSKYGTIAAIVQAAGVESWGDLTPKQAERLLFL